MSASAVWALRGLTFQKEGAKRSTALLIRQLDAIATGYSDAVREETALKASVHATAAGQGERVNCRRVQQLNCNRHLRSSHLR